MYDVDYVKSVLRLCQNQHRYEHSLGVANTCKILAKLNDFDEKKAFYTGLLHDITKQLDDKFHMANKSLIDQGSINVRETWHAYTAVQYIMDNGIYADEEILEAIREHVEGSQNPSMLSKILFVADYIEPNRNYESCILARKLLLFPLDVAYATIACEIYNYLVKSNCIITNNNFETYQKFKNLAIDLR